MTSLFFDTAHPDGPRIGLQVSEREIIWAALPGQWHSTEQIMPTLLRLLKKHNLSLRDVERVLVVPGPGSFTAVRAGVVWGNALAYALSLPLGEIARPSAGQTIGKVKPKRIVRPVYGAEPHISGKNSKK
jgi:tRNA A37 threonylcarbamoyladenosine modification protein TsaB